MNTSFMKSLFAGIIDQDTIFPYPEISRDDKENLDLILQAWHEFANDNVDPVQIDKDEKIPESVLDGLKELGFFGLSIPEKYGGGSLSKTMYCRIFEDLCVTDASIGVSFGAHASIGAIGIIEYGTDKIKEKYLPKMATGEYVAAFALTEPGAGSDAAGIKTRAVLNEAKSHFILNGSKIWISNGGISDIWTVFAKTDVVIDGVTKEKITAFAVEAGWEGCSHGPSEHKLGIRGSNTTTLSFDNVQVPVENMLGQLGKGFKVAMEILNSGRLGLAAGNVGGCKELIRLSIEFAKNRKQFGCAIADFEIIQDKISAMIAEAYAAESMVYLTAGLADRGNVDFSLESAISKVFASESLWHAANETMQIAGGQGYSREYPYERILRDSRINLIFEGTNEVLRVFVALAGMQEPGEYLKKIGKALRQPIKGLGLLTEFAVSHVKDKVKKDTLKKIHATLKKEADYFNTYAAELQNYVEKVLMKYGKNIIHQEFVLQRLANMAIQLYGIAAVLSRVNAMLDKDMNVERDVPTMQLFCDKAWRTIRREARQIDTNMDDTRRSISKTAYDLEKFPFDIFDVAVEKNES